MTADQRWTRSTCRQVQECSHCHVCGHSQVNIHIRYVGITGGGGDQAGQDKVCTLRMRGQDL
jgi:hypothetical protein